MVQINTLKLTKVLLFKVLLKYNTIQDNILNHLFLRYWYPHYAINYLQVPLTVFRSGPERSLDSSTVLALFYDEVLQLFQEIGIVATKSNELVINLIETIHLPMLWNK